MANPFNRLPSFAPAIGIMLSSGQSGQLLDTAYTYNSAGKAVSYRFIAPVTSTLTDVFFYMTAHTGTPGNLTVELRDYSTATKPGSTLIASQTVSPGTTDNKWIDCIFSSPGSVTAGNMYFIVVADAAGNVSNNATIARVGGLSSALSLGYNLFDSISTTGGFNTGNTDHSITAPCVLKFGDGTVLGNAYNNGNQLYSSNTLERGIKIVSLTEKLNIFGVYFPNSSANCSGFKIYSGTTAPGGTTDLTVTFGTGEGANGVAMFTPFTLQKNTVYRCILTFSANATIPRYIINNDHGNFASVDSCEYAGGNMHETIDNGAGGWTDNQGRIPQMALLVSDQVAIAANATQLSDGVMVLR